MNLPSFTTGRMSFGPGVLYIGEAGTTPTTDVGAVRSGAALTLRREVLEIWQGSPRTVVKRWAVEESASLAITGIEWNLSHLAEYLGINYEAGPPNRVDFGGLAGISSMSLKFVHQTPEGGTVELWIWEATGAGSIEIGFGDEVHEFPYMFNALYSPSDWGGGDLSAGSNLLKLKHYSYVAPTVDHVYVAATGYTNDSVVIIDAETPSSPSLLSELHGAGSSNYWDGVRYLCKSAGDYLYVAANTDDYVDIFSVADPAGLSRVGGITDGYLNSVVDVDVAEIGDNEYMFITGLGGYFAVYSLSNPTSPSFENALSISTSRGLMVSGNYAYVVCHGDDSLRSIDVSTPSTPVQVDSISGAGSPNYLDYPTGVFVSGNYAYVAARDDNALTIFDVSDPAGISHEGYIAGSGSPNYLGGAWKVFVSGNYAYVISQTDEALSIFDVSTPSSPSLVGTICGSGPPNYLGSPQDVYVLGDYAYVTAAGENAVTIIDVSTPSSPLYVGRISGDGAPNYLGGTKGLVVWT